MTYQDKWLNGRCIERGTRECANRYAIIREFCSTISDRLFTVCDIGANMCYFGIRLAEDFPYCRVTAFEFHSFEMRQRHVQANAVGMRVALMKKKLSLEDVESLSSAERFDVVLALSVAHHLTRGGDFERWIAALRSLGKHLIMEFALTDSKRAAKINDYAIPTDAKILGFGKSHLNHEVRRPIVLLEGK